LIIDIIVMILLSFAAFRGYRMGLIAGVGSFLSLMVGLAAAMKLSVVVAAKIGESANVAGRWLPFISFLIVFSLTVIIVRMIARLLQKFTETILLGWVDKIGGILFFGLMYLSFFGVILFYVNKLELLPANTETKSLTYQFIKPIGRAVVDSMGVVIPVFKNMFAELEQFFGAAAERV